MSEALGLIVGSGFSRLELEVVARSPTKTPYGAPSAAILTVKIGERRVACLARHGEDHALDELTVIAAGRRNVPGG